METLTSRFATPIRVTRAVPVPLWSKAKSPLSSIGPTMTLMSVPVTLRYGPGGSVSSFVVPPTVKLSSISPGVVLIRMLNEPTPTVMPGMWKTTSSTVKLAARPSGLIRIWPWASWTSTNVVPPAVSLRSEVAASSSFEMATFTTWAPVASAPCSIEKLPKMLCPATVSETLSPATRTRRVARCVSIVTLRSAEKATPGMSTATVPMKLPSIPRASMPSVALAPVTVTAPPPSESVASVTVSSVLVGALREGEVAGERLPEDVDGDVVGGEAEERAGRQPGERAGRQSRSVSWPPTWKTSLTTALVVLISRLSVPCSETPGCSRRRCRRSGPPSPPRSAGCCRCRSSARRRRRARRRGWRRRRGRPAGRPR